MPDISALWLLPALLAGTGLGWWLAQLRAQHELGALNKRLAKAKKAYKELADQAQQEHAQLQTLKAAHSARPARTAASDTTLPPSGPSAPPAPPPRYFDSSLIGLRPDSDQPDFAETQIHPHDSRA